METEMLNPGQKEVAAQEITQTRPFNPTATSKEIFCPRASRTGHGGELSSLITR